MDRTRLLKINIVAERSTLVFDNRKGHKTYSVFSTRTGKCYQVKAMWDWNGPKKEYKTVQTFLHTFDVMELKLFGLGENGITITPANKDTTPKNGIMCHPANVNSYTVDYMSIGALKGAAKRSGKLLSVCKNEASARRLLHLGGELLKISNRGSGVIWATVRDIKPSITQEFAAMMLSVVTS